jgi:biotin operon repressor
MQPIGGFLKQRFDQVVVQSQMLRAGFASLPYMVMRDTQLSLGARLTYAFLLMYAWQEGSTFAGQDKMATDMGVSRAQVQRYLYELRDTGYIGIAREDKRYNNTYIILEKPLTKLKARNKGKKSRIERDASPMMRPTHH